MTKAFKTASDKVAAKVVRNPKTGQFVTVHGAGALKGELKIKKGLGLTKPIAEQALSDRPEKRKAG